MADREKKETPEKALPRKKKDLPGAPDLPGGGLNSEHESETSGMRRSAAIEGSKEPEEEVGEEETPSTRHLRTTSYTHMDRVAEAEGEGDLAARTPQEMSQHDELSRVAREKERDRSS